MRLLERERIEPTGQMKERKNRLQYTFFQDLYMKTRKFVIITSQKNYFLPTIHHKILQKG